MLRTGIQTWKLIRTSSYQKRFIKERCERVINDKNEKRDSFRIGFVRTCLPLLSTLLLGNLTNKCDLWIINEVYYKYFHSILCSPILLIIGRGIFENNTLRQRK
jgi:hypothetical protein